MQEWEKKFDSVALSKGIKLYREGKVENVQKNETLITAIVPGIPPYEVSIMQRNQQPVRMKCQCPKAKGGRNCEHMAAACCAVYGVNEESEEPVKPQKLSKAMIIRQEAIKKAEEKAAIRAAEEVKKEAEEAKKAAEQEEIIKVEQEKARKEAAKRIEQRNAERAAKKAERKQKRLEAEEAARKLAHEVELKRIAEETRKQEELEKKAEQERLIKAAEEAARKKQEEERERKKAEKVQAAIERRALEKEEVEAAEKENAARTNRYAKMLESDVIEDFDSDLEPESYSYFDFTEIRKSLKVLPDEAKAGKKLYIEGQLQIEQFGTGYLEDEEDLVAEVHAKGNPGKKEFAMRMILTRTRIRYVECGCPKCRQSNYWYSPIGTCDYQVGMLHVIEDYVRFSGEGDATDKNGMGILRLFQEQHVTQVLASTFETEETLEIVPRLQNQNDRLSLSFKVGSEKLYVIKDLLEFSDQVRNGETVVYGNNTKMNHKMSNFTEEGQLWVRYIQQIMLEETQLEERLSEAGWYYGRRKNRRNSVDLYGWKLDQFYQLMGKTGIEYEDKSAGKKGKQVIYCMESAPKVKMEIQKSKIGKEEEFHGIDVSCKMPVFFNGSDNYYFLDKQYLCKAKAEEIEGFRLLTEYAEDGRMHFRVGRNNLSEFYYRILPELRESVDISERNSEEIHAYLPPDVQFLFYLDAQDHNLTCKLHAKYGEREVSVFDLLESNTINPPERFRMQSKEAEMLHITRTLFPEIDIAEDELHCGHDDELMYYVLEHGAETLMEYGEVQCTQRFRKRNVIRKLKVTVGVSVSSELLNLDIDAEDISRAELLDVLKSYRVRKKFYRLKNGDFLTLEDNNLELLGELMESMRVSPKEFIKGKMHLPVYRTLYLDKLLEENENIYSTRDSYFREIVKRFKTVNEADYEEPASLAGIMRGYQKKGYRWLRTLESCQFGGILADDMGLGKTLQTISMLLAAKEEGKEGTSLVVSPSSLVFNWGEELQRFAPQLKVLMITGNQTERQQKLNECASYDVLVTSYDLLKRDIVFYEDKLFMYEIIDEAQYIKNHTTAASKAVKVIHSQYRYAMTGTPIENRLSELWSIFDFLMPGFLYGYDVFKKEFETPIVKNGDEEALKRLQKMVGAFILRRLKSDVLKDLPDKLEEIRYVQMEDSQRTAYEAQVVHMQTQISGQNQEEFSRNKMRILAELMKLRQICCDPSLCFENYGGESAKLECCLELIQSAIDGGHKLLLFSQFTTMLEILQHRLSKLGIEFYTITGSIAKEKRLQMVKAFNEDSTPVFLISLKAGGVGLNLTGADVVIHYDPWWNQAVQNQATDRAHRIGQTKKVTVYKLIMKHSIEEKIQKLQETKMDLADQIVNGQGAQIGSMSQIELLELLEA